MTTKDYKLRAECLHDILMLLNSFDFSFSQLNIESEGSFPDCFLSFTSSMSLKEIKDLIKEIPDGHVMLETVQYKENYTGLR